MRRRRGGFGNTVMTILTGLFAFGIFLAVLAQFGGDLGDMAQWFLNMAWNFVLTVRNTIASWDTFQRIF